MRSPVALVCIMVAPAGWMPHEFPVVLVRRMVAPAAWLFALPQLLELKFNGRGIWPF